MKNFTESLEKVPPFPFTSKKNNFYLQIKTKYILSCKNMEESKVGLFCLKIISETPEKIEKQAQKLIIKDNF